LSRINRFSRVTGLSAVLVAGALILGVSPDGSVSSTTSVRPVELFHPAIRLNGREEETPNWSGYASTNGPFSSVSASWVQPAATCNGQDSQTFASFWVGLDGDGTPTVEQTGTDTDCTGTHAEYTAWFEMYPHAESELFATVEPGDQMSASVTDQGGTFQLVLHDVTRKWSRTEVRTATQAKGATAEVIAEAPSAGSKVLPLTNFGSVNFIGAEADGSQIGQIGVNQFVMGVGPTIEATPSSLLDGMDFYITWLHH
jgi:hypothetical protein